VRPAGAGRGQVLERRFGITNGKPGEILKKVDGFWYDCGSRNAGRYGRLGTRLPTNARLQTMISVENIPLAVRPAWKAIYAVNAIGCLLFALAGFWMLFSAVKVQDLGMALLTIIFFGGGGLMILRMLTRPPGRIELRPEGLFIESYFTVGMADWANLAEVDAVRVLGITYLGIRLENAEKYLASRDLLQDRRSIRNVAFVSFAARALFTMAKIPLVKQSLDVIFSVLGYSALPERLREIDLLEYNAKNVGYHLLFPVFLLAAKPAQIAPATEGRFGSGTAGRSLCGERCATEPERGADRPGREGMPHMRGNR